MAPTLKDCSSASTPLMDYSELFKPTPNSKNNGSPTRMNQMRWKRCYFALTTARSFLSSKRRARSKAYIAEYSRS